ncbi:MAG: 5-oxoprolinase subunit PxpB [Acidobacteria bacterium]|nr:5-oxoprolinase subunit PxpB [Acidobacteriota bacterium]
MSHGIRVQRASDQSLLVMFDQSPSPRFRPQVARFARTLIEKRPQPLLDAIPAYATVLLIFDPRTTRFREVEELVERTLEEIDGAPELAPREIIIPVSYGDRYGPDLEDVGRINGLAPEEVIRIHSRGSYRVCFLGFSPGFPYLDGLDPAIATPRLSTPRTHVPAGSVAIGGTQTGIYPLDSPGGWRIIGRTAVRLFDSSRGPATLLDIGDVVRFRAVNQVEHARGSNGLEQSAG